MKKKRRLSIANQRLKLIRDNLRYIIISKTKEIILDLTSQRLRENDSSIKAELLQKERKLSRLMDSSICSCPVCHVIDKDMIFNPSVKQWFCPDCYELMANEYYTRKAARARGEDHDDFHEGFYKSFTY